MSGILVSNYSLGSFTNSGHVSYEGIIRSYKVANDHRRVYRRTGRGSVLTKRSAHIDTNPDPRANLIVCGLRIGAKRLKQLFAIVLSTAAICAFASATPAAAQVAAAPVDTQDQTPYMQQSDRTQAYTTSSADPA